MEFSPSAEQNPHGLSTHALSPSSGITEASQPSAGEPATNLSGARLVNPWQPWVRAARQALSPFLVSHIIFLALTYLAILFKLGNFSLNRLSPLTFIHSWERWDTTHYLTIATQGYDVWWRTAFFPLYPLLEGAGARLVGHPFLVGLLLSNLATFGLLMVLYRLVEEDLEVATARRAVLYLSVFPAAFFLAAAYNEALFILLALLSFYFMRRGRWWLAGLMALLASLTRSAGIVLVLPFCYEYLRQREFKLSALRLDALAVAGAPLGIGLFALYCASRFHNPLTFSLAQQRWQRFAGPPWSGLVSDVYMIFHAGPTSFTGVHDLLDLGAVLFILALVVAGWIGPWRFPRSLRAYSVYATGFLLFYLLLSSHDLWPLQSMTRCMLEVVPAFVVLAVMGRREEVHLNYLVISTTLLAFLLLQFLTGGWIV
jgi:hypothetical protein